MSDFPTRFEAVTRRTFMKRAAAFGTAAMFGLVACGDDQDTFASSRAPATTTTGSTTTSAVAATTTTLDRVGSSDSSVQTTALDSVPFGAELIVAFTYAAESSSRGPARNPYVAVWVEDTQGDLVNTIALWFLQQEKGMRWLSDLRRWYGVDGTDETITTISGATRAPGSYTVVWDGTELDGAPVDQGDYYICIEAAREHGPYSLIREPLRLSDEAFTQSLSDDKELRDASVELVLA